MSHWNHRVVRRKGMLNVCEVFYNDDGKPAAHTMEAVGATAETLDELKEYIGWMMKALEHPILDSDTDFVGFEGEDDAGETS